MSKFPLADAVYALFITPSEAIRRYCREDIERMQRHRAIYDCIPRIDEGDVQ